MCDCVHCPRKTVVARSLDDDDDDDITLGSGDPHWETKSHFTEYSITSSVMPRNKGVSVGLCVSDVE